MAEHLLEVRELHARVVEEEDEILRGLNLVVEKGKIHALMGPNGSGKSTLAKVIMGHPSYEVTSGEVRFNGRNILELEADERARMGIFLAFQYPSEIPGVTIANFLRGAVNARRQGRGEEEIDVFDFQELLTQKLALLQMDESFAGRYVNDGFSGGEKKRNEILQMALLEPELAVLDETDSGLDIDALKIVANGVNTVTHWDGAPGILLITHYQRILNYIRPDHVHVMIDGVIAESGGPDLADKLEEHGYDWLREEAHAV